MLPINVLYCKLNYYAYQHKHHLLCTQTYVSHSTILCQASSWTAYSFTGVDLVHSLGHSLSVAGSLKLGHNNNHIIGSSEQHTFNMEVAYMQLHGSKYMWSQRWQSPLLRWDSQPFSHSLRKPPRYSPFNESPGSYCIQWRHDRIYSAFWSWFKAKAMPLHWNHFNHTLSSQWDSFR